MGNILLCWPNRFVSGQIIVSDAVPGMSAEQLANDQGNPAQAWQTNGKAGTVNLQIPAADVWRVVGLFRTNLTATATWRIRVWAGVDTSAASAWDSGTVPCGVVTGYGQAVRVLPPGVVGRMLQVDISDPANPDGHLNIPQAFGGTAWQPEHNPGYASLRQRDDSTNTVTTRSGAEIVRNDWQRRGRDLAFGTIRPWEVLTIEQLDAQARLGGNILVVPNPDSATINQEAVFGRLKPAAGGIGYGNNSAQTRTWRATIMERL